MKKRRGLALIPVLWIVVLAGSLVMTQATRSANALVRSHNRVLLTAAQWARQACLGIVRSRLAAVRLDSAEHEVRARTLPNRVLHVARTDLGSGVSCEAHFVDLGAVVNVNEADSALLSCVLGDEGLRAVLARRPFPNEDAITIVLANSVDSARRVWLSARGPNRFNLNTAPLELLQCLDEIGPIGAMTIALARRDHREFGSVTELIDQLPIALRRDMVRLSRTQERLTVLPPLGVVVIEGAAGWPAITATLRLFVRLRGTDVDLLSVEER